MIVQIEENNKSGSAYIGDSTTTKAQMTFSKAGENLIIIDHTEVSDVLRGQGVGRKLLDKIVTLARERVVKIVPLCPYAKSVFEKDKSISDVLK